VQFTLDVTLNTSLADLDDALSLLLRRELAATGFQEVGIAFEAPNREWAASVTQPTLNLFLYDLRENQQRRAAQWERGEVQGRRNETRPPLWLDASYTLTAWARAAQDEHRMLSQAISTLQRYPELPEDVLSSEQTGQLRRLGPLRTRLGDPQLDANADFWTAIGGPYKLSFHYIVTIPFPSGAVLYRGPPVRTPQLIANLRKHNQ
jgi:Pvc16 N-terminal domain